MNRPAAAPPQLRGMPTNVFGGQQQQQQAGPRSAGLNGGRLQNGKLGLASSQGWGFNMNMSGAPGNPSSQQSRTNPANLSSFAQTIGTSQNHTSLDPSEFPSLSGAPQAQQQQPSSHIWGNASLRGSQQGPVQRPQMQSQQPSTSRLTGGALLRHQDDQSSDLHNSPFPQLGAGLDGLRLDDSIRYGDESRYANQNHTDDFPPLGGLGDVSNSQARRAANGQYNSIGSGHDPSGMQRQTTSAQQSSRIDGVSNAFPGMGGVGSPTSVGAAASRSPFEQDGTERSYALRNEPAGLASNQGEPRSSAMDVSRQTSGEYDPQVAQQHMDDSVPNTSEDAQLNGSSSSMYSLDKWGLKGLMDTLRGENGADQASLAYGMDLTTLGLDLSRPDNAPLYETWAGPFADPTSRPIVPDFTLPPAYSVQNVPPLSTKINSFTDDTLFAIFYQCPRDVAQELAANELYARDWRWHTKLRQWMMKAKELGEPQQLPSSREERGWYYFFDVNNWRKERKEFILNYEHLYHIPQNSLFSPP